MMDHQNARLTSNIRSCSGLVKVVIRMHPSTVIVYHLFPDTYILVCNRENGLERLLDHVHCVDW